jgi:hypothetical protein
VSRIGWCLALGAIALVVAACGTSKSTERPAAVKPQPEATRPHCSVDSTRGKRTLPKINADIARIRHATTHARTSKETDRFINDLDRSRLSLKSENRLIDRAISAALGKCDDCFQALEAMRPIPSIAHNCG